MIAYRQLGLRSTYLAGPNTWLYRARDGADTTTVRVSSYFIDHTHADGGECIVQLPTWIGLGHE